MQIVYWSSTTDYTENAPKLTNNLCIHANDRKIV